MFCVTRVINRKIYGVIKHKKSCRRCSTKVSEDDDKIAYEKYVKNPTEQLYASFAGEMRNTKHPQLKGSKKPFVKNFFKGVYDTDLLSYPQVLHNEPLTSLERNVDFINKVFLENIDPAEIDKTATIPDKILEAMRSLLLFGQKIPVQYGGLNFSNTEYARVMEAISTDVSLPLIQYTHEILCSKSIQKYGTEDQKSKYLPKLASGECLATLCLEELEAGLEDIFSINTTAVRVAEGWCLNGRKMWVLNAPNSHLYLVVARTMITEKEMDSLMKGSDDNFFYDNNALYNTKEGMYDKFKKYSNGVTVFMVDKSSNGISYDVDNTLGVRGLNLCSVNFIDTIVPDENVLGKVNHGHEIIVQCPANERFVLGCVATSVMKSLLNDVTKYAVKTNLVFMKLYERGITQTRIAEINIYLYAIESMIYMTCGLLDLYNDYDATVEAAIVKVFSSDIAWHCVSECLNTYGAKSYSKNFSYERYLRNVKVLSLFDVNNDILRLFIASMGLRYVTDEKSDAIRKERNPFFHPNYALKMFWKTHEQSADNVRYNLKLDKFVHPSLKEAAMLLEYCVLRFEYTVHVVLSRYGPEVADKEMILKRIADCVISLYAMASVLSRASRAYCIGLRNADVDLQIAETFIKDEHRKLKEVYDILLADEYSTTDGVYEKLSDQSVKTFGYCCQHPTKDNC